VPRQRRETPATTVTTTPKRPTPLRRTAGASAVALDTRKVPRQARAVATVDAVLEAAALIIERDGYDGYTTNAVAQQAGVSIGSLYQYFPNKDALTRALIMGDSTQLLAAIEAASLKNSGTHALGQMIDIAIAHQLKKPTLARFLDMEERRLPVDAEIERIRHRLIQAVVRCLQAPDLPAHDRSEIAAADLVAITRGLCDLAAHGNAADNARLKERVERAVFGYLHYGASGNDPGT
jgi:AcrR family transcriptional regulator